MAEFFRIRGCPLMFYPGRFEGNSITTEIQAPETYFVNGKAEITITAFLFDDPQDKDIDLNKYKNIPSVFMENAIYPNVNVNTLTKKYGTIKSIISNSFDLQWDGYQNLIVEFPNELNIRIDYKDYPPVVSWDSYPDGNVLRYEVAIIVNNNKNRLNPRDNIKDTTWQVGFKGYAQATSIDVYSNSVRFREVHGSDGIIISPYLVPGDVFRIEVYVNGFMDSEMILVK
jgi:hypothetical protein